MEQGFLKKLYRIEAVKVATQVLLLLFLFSIQLSQPDFIHWSLQSVALLLLSISLLFHLIYIYFLKNIKEKVLAHYLVFFFDIVWLSILLYYFSSIQALFVFLYLIHILLSGLVLQKLGALYVAAFTSLAFSLVLVFSPELEGSLLFLSLGLNNLGFFLIAILSGTLSEQLKELGSQLEKRTKDLQVLKDLNSLIIDNMQSGLISYNLQNEVLLFNKSAEKILEKDISEKMHLDFLIPHFEKNKTREQNNSKYPYHLLYRVNNKTKNLVFLVSDIYSQEKEKIGGLIIFSDQTEFRRLEDEKRQNEKLAAIGKLAAGIAHEIRNPLASMSGSIEFLSANLSLTKEEDKKLMKIVLKEIDRLNSLVSEFLDFAKPEKPLIEKVDLSKLCHDVIAMLKRDQRFDNSIDLTTDLADKIEIIGDNQKLQQVLLNLMINALEAMNNTSVKQLRIHLVSKDNNAILSVSDSGEGMTEEVKQRLFEPFHTTKAKGTGLGLAMVHKILDQHRAKIRVESKIGQGTSFELYFPLP